MPVKRDRIGKRKSTVVKKLDPRKLQFEVEKTIRNKEFVDLVKREESALIDFKKNLFIFEIKKKPMAVNMQRLADNLGPRAVITAFALGAKKPYTWQDMVKSSGFKIGILQKEAINMKKQGLINFKV